MAKKRLEKVDPMTVGVAERLRNMDQEKATRDAFDNDRQSILRKLFRADPADPLTAYELELLTNEYGTFDPSMMDDPNSEVAQIAQAIQEYPLALRGDTSALDRLTNLGNSFMGGDMMRNRGRNISETLLRAGDVGIGAAQQRQANESLSQQRAPIEPPMMQRSPMLAERLRRASTESAAPLSSAEIRAMRSGISDAYGADMNAARVASGGQAGSYGALGQSAINRRYRNQMQLPAAIAQTRRQADSNLNSLLGLRQSEANMIGNDRRLGYNQRLNQYNIAQKAAGDLGAAGRTNMRRGFGGIAQSMGELYDWEDYFNNQLMGI